MLVTLNNNVDRRLQSWCKYTHLSPEVFIIDAVERSLDDWEDYNDALRICAEVDAGRMKTYSLDDVERHLDALEVQGREVQDYMQASGRCLTRTNRQNR